MMSLSEQTILINQPSLRSYTYHLNLILLSLSILMRERQRARELVGCWKISMLTLPSCWSLDWDHFTHLLTNLKTILMLYIYLLFAQSTHQVSVSKHEGNKIGVGEGLASSCMQVVFGLYNPASYRPSSVASILKRSCHQSSRMKDKKKMAIVFKLITVSVANPPRVRGLQVDFVAPRQLVGVGRRAWCSRRQCIYQLFIIPSSVLD